MWPGEQPPGRGPQHNPYQQPGYQQPNPYQQPGYQQPNPQQRPASWDRPAPVPPGPGGGRTKLVAVLSAAAVVVAAGVTGFLLLGGKGDDQAGPGPTASASRSAAGSASPAADDSRSASGPKPTIAGWKVVVNPDTGIAFDVPADWQVRSKSWIHYVTDDAASDEKILAAMKAPAVLKEKWCGADDDRDGRTDYSSLADVGTRAEKDAGTAARAARGTSANWVYGQYAQPDREKVSTGAVTRFTTTSGITGSVATSRSSGVEHKGRCDVDGKAVTFAFKDPDGALLSWSLVGAAGVSDEVPDATARRIMATVRLYDTSPGS